MAKAKPAKAKAKPAKANAKLWIPIAGFAALLSVLSVIGLIRGTDASTGGAARGTGAVKIADFAFSPDQAKIAVGDQITWTNTDDVTHTVTSDDKAFDSDKLAPKASFVHKFTEAGTYKYHCSIHESMHGEVEVR